NNPNDGDTMAKLFLYREDTTRDALPELCMKCGQPAVDHIRRPFSWYPPWVGLTILIAWPVTLVLILVLTKKMTVDVPVCERHRGYWWKRQLLMFLPMLVFLFLGILLAVAFDQMGEKDLVGLACLAFVLIGVVWLFVAAAIQTMMIRPTEITDDSITLKNVDESFVQAFEHRERRRRRRDRDDDDDEYDPHPRPRRAPVDDEHRES